MLFPLEAASCTVNHKRWLQAGMSILGILLFSQHRKSSCSGSVLCRVPAALGPLRGRGAGRARAPEDAANAPGALETAPNADITPILLSAANLSLLPDG